jgi:hypothetical protein
MKQKLYSIIAVAVLLVSRAIAQPVIVYQQDFQSGIPGNMTLINQDGLTPNTNVAFINNSWVADTDPDDANNVLAVSTSWYTPAGTANDWIITPAITIPAGGATLKFRTRSADPNFADGFEVRCGNTPNIAGQTNLLLSVAAEQATWNNRFISLNSFAGQTIHISFRNNSNDKLVLFLDDILVQEASDDISVSDAVFPSQYTSIPKSQANGTFNLGATLTNVGGNNATNVSVSLRVLNLTTVSVVSTQTLTGSGTLAGGASGNYTGTPVPHGAAGLYAFEYICSMAATDADVSNDTFVRFVNIDDALYSRDETFLFGQLDGASGIGQGITGQLAQKFSITNQYGVELDTVFAFFAEKRVGARYRAKLYTSSAGQPNLLVWTSNTYTTTAADTVGGANGLIGLTSNTPFRNFVAGDYFVAVEQMDTFNYRVGFANDIFTPNMSFFTTNGTTWTNLTGQAGGQFEVAFLIWPHLKDINCTLSVSPNPTNPTCEKSNGAVNTTVTGNNGTVNYIWSTGAQNANVIGLAPGTYKVTVTNDGCIDSASVTLSNVGLKPTFTLITTPSACAASDGSVIVNNAPSGSSYAWNATPNPGNSDTAANLPAGFYTVTVTFNGCSVDSSATVSNPNAPQVTATVTSQVSCHNGADGEASASATGGNGTYTFIWSSNPTQNGATASNLTPGVYAVSVVDQSLCLGTGSVQLDNPVILDVNISLTQNPTCSYLNNGAALAVGSGGTGTLTYGWSNSTIGSSINNGTGTVTVYVQDANSCVDSASFTFVSPAALSPSVTVNSSILCKNATNGSATVFVSGGTGNKSYAWGTTPTQTTAQAVGLAAGTYFVTITDQNSCTATTSATITEPAFELAATTTTSANSSTVTASGGTAPYTYTWSTNPQQTTATATGLTTGTYSVTVKDANQCSVVKVVVISSIEDAQAAGFNTISVYPNPTSGLFNISASLVAASSTSMEIIDITGKVINKTDLGTGTTIESMFDVSNIAKGIYTLRFQTNIGTVSQRLIVQ